MEDWRKPFKYSLVGERGIKGAIQVFMGWGRRTGEWGFWEGAGERELGDGGGRWSEVG